jgi:transposase
VVLANVLRTDRAAHRPLPADTELARAIKVLARAQQDAVWDRTRAQLRLRSLLREFYPAALVVAARLEDGFTAPLLRTLLAAAPTPTAAAALSLPELEDLVRRSGRRRRIAATAAWLHQVLTAEQLHQPARVEAGLGQQTLALLRLLEAACANSDQLADAATQVLEQHPDAPIILSFPGLGPVLGARLLGEIGDDHTRFTDARALKAHAGASPVTRASGRSRHVFTRRVKNQRLAAVGYQWAFSSLTASPGARAHYARRRAAGDTHVRAQRNLYNRFLGMLHHCLATGRPYREERAFPAQGQADRIAAA